MATRRKRGREVANNYTNNFGNNKKLVGDVEENTMAMLDFSGFKISSSSNNDHNLIGDRLAFLEAVRSASLRPENGNAPTNKMYEAIFDILKNENSLDLLMASYQLLVELDKRFPRVFLNEVERTESSSNSFDVVVVDEAWSPFIFRMETAGLEEEVNNSSGLIDALGFHSLVEEVAEVVNNRKTDILGTKFLRHLLLLQYLLRVLEEDFLPRSHAFLENMNWALLRGSLLNLLLGSRKIIYKGFIKDCLCLMCEISLGDHDATARGCSSLEQDKISESALAFALPEVEKSTCVALKKLLLMIMELDSSRSVAAHQGLTSRADGVRTHAGEIILDELTYNNDLLAPFLRTFDEQSLKLKLVVQYFQKYIPKSSVRTRKSNCTSDNATFGGILKYLSNSTFARNMVKKIGADVVQLLLAHAFQAYLSLSLQHSAKGISYTNEDEKDSSLPEICQETISAFTCLIREAKGAEIIAFSKEALFTAKTILSTK